MANRRTRGGWTDIPGVARCVHAGFPRGKGLRFPSRPKARLGRTNRSGSPPGGRAGRPRGRTRFRGRRGSDGAMANPRPALDEIERPPCWSLAASVAESAGLRSRDGKARLPRRGPVLHHALRCVETAWAMATLAADVSHAVGRCLGSVADPAGLRPLLPFAEGPVCGRMRGGLPFGIGIPVASPAGFRPHVPRLLLGGGYAWKDRRGKGRRGKRRHGGPPPRHDSVPSPVRPWRHGSRKVPPPGLCPRMESRPAPRRAAKPRPSR